MGYNVTAQSANWILLKEKMRRKRRAGKRRGGVRRPFYHCPTAASIGRRKKPPDANFCSPKIQRGGQRHLRPLRSNKQTNSPRSSSASTGRVIKSVILHNIYILINIYIDIYIYKYGPY